MIHKNLMFSADFSVNSEPIAFKFCKGYCQVPILKNRRIIFNISKVRHVKIKMNRALGHLCAHIG